MSSQERRQYARLKTQLGMRYAVLGAGAPVASRTHDTSGGGVCFFTGTKFERGAVMQIAIDYPGRAVTFTGQVVWSGEVLVKDDGEPAPPFQTGVKFVSITPQDLAFVTQHCAS